MKEIPYHTLKENGTAYKLMLIRDQCGSSFEDIAKKLGISKKCAKDTYFREKNKQIFLYINHIALSLGHSNDSKIRNVYCKAKDFYCDDSYVCAYLEEKYRDILTEYRHGEPGMRAEFINSMPPFRPILTKEETERIVKMHEKNKAPFAEIAKELCITPQKARDTYDLYYHEKVKEIFNELEKNAESEEEKERIWKYCFWNCLSSKKRYEMLTKNQ